jgi:alpha-ribazole phosphatase
VEEPADDMKEKPVRIYLVRHGQVEGFQQKRYNGQGDVPLTVLGRSQYQALRERLADKPLRAVYSSELARCLSGARLLAEPHGLTPVASAGLRELHMGQWQGLTWETLQERYPRQWQDRLRDIVNYRVPGGESLLDLAARIRPFVQRVLAERAGQELLLVAHGAVNRVILLDAIGAPLNRLFHLEQDYGCLNIIDYYADGTGMVRLLNG